MIAGVDARVSGKVKRISAAVATLIVLLLLLIVGGAAWLLYSNVAGLVASAIALEVTEATQAEVSVGTISIDLGAGSADVATLTIANPDGFSDRSAISLEGVVIDLAVFTVIADPIVIERIRVGGAHVLVEQAGADNNLRKILASMRRDRTTAAEADGKRLIVERLEVAGARATLLAPQSGEGREILMPDLVVTAIGRDTGGATVASIAEQAIAPLVRMALESAAAERARGAGAEQSGATEDPLERGAPEAGRDGEP